MAVLNMHVWENNTVRLVICDASLIRAEKDRTNFFVSNSVIDKPVFIQEEHSQRNEYWAGEYSLSSGCVSFTNLYEKSKLPPAFQLALIVLGVF